MALAGLFRLSSLRQNPKWIEVLLLCALLEAAMPRVHVAVFGAERIRRTVVESLEAELGSTLGAEAQEHLDAAVLASVEPSRLGLGFLVAATQILLLGGFLNLGALFVGGDVRPRQCLSIASVASFWIVSLRILGFFLVAWLAGRDAAVRVDWLHVMDASLASLFEPHGHPVLRTLAGGADLVQAFGVVWAATALRAMDLRMGLWAALLASALFPLFALTGRVALAAMIGLPVA